MDVEAIGIANNVGRSTVPFVYNADIGLRRWRAALAKLDAGLAGIVNLNVLGDSITEGARSGGGNAGVTTSWITNGYVGRIRAALKTKYGDCGTGMIPTYYPNGAPYWTFSGTGWVSNDGSFGCTGSYMQSSVLNDTATISFTGTGFNVICAKGNAAGNFSISVDGGAATNFNANNATTISAVVFSVSGLANAAHTLTLTNTTGGATGKVFLIGGYPTVGSTGVQVNMVGRWGTVASQSTGVQYLPSEIDIFSPALTIIAFTANDYNGQTSLSAYQSSLQTLITRAQQFGDVLLISDGIRGDVVSPTIQQSQYVQTLKALAIQNGCAFLDLFNRWKGDPNYVNTTLGFYTTSDTVHPNDYGHQDMATAILRQILERGF